MCSQSEYFVAVETFVAEEKFQVLLWNDARMRLLFSGGKKHTVK